MITLKIWTYVTLLHKSYLKCTFVNPLDKLKSSSIERVKFRLLCGCEQNSPIFVVPKTNGTPPDVLDFISLNANSVDDTYTMQSIEDWKTFEMSKKGWKQPQKSILTSFWMCAAPKSWLKYTTCNHKPYSAIHYNEIIACLFIFDFMNIVGQRSRTEQSMAVYIAAVVFPSCQESLFGAYIAAAAWHRSR